MRLALIRKDSDSFETLRTTKMFAQSPKPTFSFILIALPIQSIIPYFYESVFTNTVVWTVGVFTHSIMVALVWHVKVIGDVLVDTGLVQVAALVRVETLEPVAVESIVAVALVVSFSIFAPGIVVALDIQFYSFNPWGPTSRNLLCFNRN